MIEHKLTRFKMWCQKVLPLVYDDSLSYYETLCKVVDYLNEVIDNNTFVIDEVEQLRIELNIVRDWIANFNTTHLEKLIEGLIPKMVFFELTDSGYFMVRIPENWSSIHFATTGLDVDVPMQPEFGHLVLLY